MLSGPRRTIANARRLRREMSLPEVLLWKELRKRPGGFKFRKQHPAGVYVLDFFCAEARLAIEVDGAAHDMGDRPERDIARDRWLGEKGVAVLRIVACDVLSDLEACVRLIVEETAVRVPLHPSAAPSGPPPRSGEE